MKDSASLKKELDGYGYWAIIKDILGWVIGNHEGTLTLSSKRRLEIISILEIPDSQRCISVKKLERLIGKLQSMHLAVHGAIGRFYTMHIALTRSRSGKRAAAYFSFRFHQDMKFWRKLCVEMIYHPTYFADLVHRPAYDLGYTNDLGLGDGGGWIDPKKDGKNYIWRIKWPSDITQELACFTNSEGTITNLGLKLAALVLQEAVLRSIITSPS